MVTRLRERAGAIAALEGVGFEWQVGPGTPSVECSTDAHRARCRRRSRRRVHPVVRLPSGAGHDAAMLSTIAPVAMLFVRCAGGVSHNPAESVTVEDVAAAIDATTRFLELVA